MDLVDNGYVHAHQLLRNLYAESGIHENLFELYINTHQLSKVEITNTHVDFIGEGKLKLGLRFIVIDGKLDVSVYPECNLHNPPELTEETKSQILDLAKVVEL